MHWNSLCLCGWEKSGGLLFVSQVDACLPSRICSVTKGKVPFDHVLSTFLRTEKVLFFSLQYSSLYSDIFAINETWNRQRNMSLMLFRVNLFCLYCVLGTKALTHERPVLERRAELLRDFISTHTWISTLDIIAAMTFDFLCQRA